MTRQLDALRADLILKLELFHAATAIKQITDQEHDPRVVTAKVQALLEDLEFAKKRWGRARVSTTSEAPI